MTQNNIVPFPSGPGGLVPKDPNMVMMEESPPIEPMDVAVTEWLEACRYLEGKPINFNEQPWVKDILNCSDPWQVWQAGRQVAKSTSLVNLIVAYGCNVPFLRQLYVTPTFKQTTVFSNDRLRPAIFDSPPIKDFFWNRYCTDNVLTRSLATPSYIKLAHCFLSADSVRGISSHVLMLDEIQDLHPLIIPVLEETLAAATRNEEIYKMGYADIRRYCGTPKGHDTALEDYWKISTQNMWHVPCNHCGTNAKGGFREWNVLDDEKNIGPEGLVCKKCGGDIHVEDGMWVQMFEDREWTGWHISQLMATEPTGWVKWRQILNKQKTYKVHLFHNEVLGVAYDSGTRPITLDQIQGCCKPSYRMEDLETGKNYAWAGLDWAMREERTSRESFTLFTIYGIMNNRFQLQFAHRFQGIEEDPEFTIQFILEKMQEYNVQIIGCDFGVGHKENLRLRKNMGPGGEMRVLEFQHTSQGAEITWDNDRFCFMLDKARRMENLFEAMKQRWIWFPRWEDEFDPYYKDIYNIYAEYNMSLRKMTYDNREPDDFFQSTLYAWEAMQYFFEWKMSFGRPTVIGAAPSPR